MPIHKDRIHVTCPLAVAVQDHLFCSFKTDMDQNVVYFVSCFMFSHLLYTSFLESPIVYCMEMHAKSVKVLYVAYGIKSSQNELLNTTTGLHCVSM